MAIARIGETLRRLQQAVVARRLSDRRRMRSFRTQGADRWIVLDCESTGLSPEKDALLAIGAVAIVDGAIRLSDRFERSLRPPVPSGVANVLIHGIGQQSQAQADDPGGVLQDWVDWLGDSPCIAFHARFDRGFLDRAQRRYLGRVGRRPWLDLAELGPSIDGLTRARSLDEWLDRYAIHVSPRHQASSDALASAMLLQCWMSRLPVGERHFRALQHRARNRHLLSR